MIIYIDIVLSVLILRLRLLHIIVLSFGPKGVERSVDWFIDMQFNYILFCFMQSFKTFVFSMHVLKCNSQ